MPTFEVRGPDRTGRYWVVEIQSEGAFLLETSRAGSYPTKLKAQTAADKLNDRINPRLRRDVKGGDRK